jgi:hypothetical protein
MKKKKKNQFCGDCGKKLICESIGAEEYIEDIDGYSYHPYKKYSTKTGKRQYVKHWFCVGTVIDPMSNMHEDFIDKKIVFHKEAHEKNRRKTNYKKSSPDDICPSQDI